jgi:hypothetical protein
MSERPSETIRRAVARIRDQHGPGYFQHEFWYALAERSGDVKGDTFDALKIAAAYLGELSP